MPLFLSESERSALQIARKEDPVTRRFYWGLIQRAEKRAQFPGLADGSTNTYWWHHASEHLTDAAMVFALKPSAVLGEWLRQVTLALVRRPVRDWIGPEFRSYSPSDPIGNLETAHLSLSIAIVLDLASGAFTSAEKSEIADALYQKGITLCKRWLERHDHLNNWRCILNAGVTVAAAVLDAKDELKSCVEEFQLCQQIFQADGSHGESLQYGNYAAYGQMLAWEALVRRAPELAGVLTLEPYVRMPRWQAASQFYLKPLSGWGSTPMPRAANFNDSAAIFRPSADLLLHIAARGKESHPEEAGLARWLFDHNYAEGPDYGPHDRASFGFVNDYGFLTLTLILGSAEPRSPQQAGVNALAGFSCGDVLARDSWEGRTILAARTGGDALQGSGHLHGDLNSFILVHNRERLLVDPGHSCYRNLIHELEASSLSHNTCTFTVENESGGTSFLQQSRACRRRFDPATKQPFAPVERGARRLLLAREGEVTAIASEASSLYGGIIREFTRFWFLCGSHAIFVVDKIASDRPVKTTWNWLLNNRDELLELKLVQPDRLVARRGDAGMKLFHLGNGAMEHPVYAYVHDAYHPLPAQLGEGKPGSGALIRWSEKSAAASRLAIHAICVDRPGDIAGWHLTQPEGSVCLSVSHPPESWRLEWNPDPLSFQITNGAGSYRISIQEGVWKLEVCS